MESFSYCLGSNNLSISSYSLSLSFSDLSDNLKADLQTKMIEAGATGTTDAVVLKFFLNSLEYTRIQNFPQHGLQFVAEVSFMSYNLFKNVSRDQLF